MSAEQSVHQEDQSIHSLAHERFPTWPPAEQQTAAGKRQRTRTVDNAASDLIHNLRGEFDHFIVTQLDSLLAEHTGYGLGHRGFSPVNCTSLITSARDTLNGLHALDRSMHKGSALSVVVRNVIVETQSLLRTFLLDFSDMAPEGELNRSGLSAAVGYCIDVAKSLGKLALGLEQLRLEMRSQNGAA